MATVVLHCYYTGEESAVRGFVEKPDWPGVVSDRVNTGIYVLSPRLRRGDVRLRREAGGAGRGRLRPV